MLDRNTIPKGKGTFYTKNLHCIVYAVIDKQF